MKNKLLKTFTIGLSLCLLFLTLAVPTFAEEDMNDVPSTYDFTSITIEEGVYLFNEYVFTSSYYTLSFTLERDTAWFSYDNERFCKMECSEGHYIFYRTFDDAYPVELIPDIDGTADGVNPFAIPRYINIFETFSVDFDEETEEWGYFSQYFTRGDVISKGSYTFYLNTDTAVSMNGKTISTVGEYNAEPDVLMLPVFPCFVYNGIEYNNITLHTDNDDPYITFAYSSDDDNYSLDVHGDFVIFEVIGRGAPVSIDDYEIFNSMLIAPSNEDGILDTLSGVADFFVLSLASLSLIFFANGSLTIIGTLAVIGVGIAVILLIFLIIRRFFGGI